MKSAVDLLPWPVHILYPRLTNVARTAFVPSPPPPLSTPCPVIRSPNVSHHGGTYGVNQLDIAARRPKALRWFGSNRFATTDESRVHESNRPGLPFLSHQWHCWSPSKPACHHHPVPWHSSSSFSPPIPEPIIDFEKLHEGSNEGNKRSKPHRQQSSSLNATRARRIRRSFSVQILDSQRSCCSRRREVMVWIPEGSMTRSFQYSSVSRRWPFSCRR